MAEEDDARMRAFIEAQAKAESEKKSLFDETITTSEEAIAKAIMTLSQTKDPQLLTEIDDKEHRLLVSVTTLAEAFDSDLLRSVVLNFEKLKVSLHRKGRAEISGIARSKQEEDAKMSKLKRLFHWG